ncbi:3-hexulose-6-phosphate isomerase [Sodalis praecaptivus]|uniref:6-phospho-3-hexuloisomerase n=1 Tax=Sodalis praecaptivus TaxID=1239307 RepID=UPI0027FA7C9B|nr:6-phospho-3-hexuloisomerase [Sodalis praecaptivus]CAJ0995663.1 3-hexulose-6-phosphate isomerase [Sodalis praecaptivus]
MSTVSLTQRLQQVARELSKMAQAINDEQLSQLAEAINRTPRVFLSGQGRSRLMVKAIAIRLMHIGLAVYVAGESNTPAIAAGDLLIAVSSSAKTPVTLSHIAAARQAGAAVALISSSPTPALQVDHYVSLPARKEVATDQHAGSLFEQSLLITGDAIAWKIQHRRAQTDAELDKRHANLQ